MLLFELLTGRTPFDAKTILEGGYRDLSRRIRQTEPERPSQRLTILNAEARATVAKSRRTAPAQLAFELRGDLDWIVMRCPEKDRARRYESASALALDLQRHLRDQPILARPPSTAYLVQKLFRRHRAAMTAALVAALVFLLGGAFSVWQAVRATRADGSRRGSARWKRICSTAPRKRSNLARCRAYAADMNLAQQAVANDNLGLAKRLLDRHRPRLHRHSLWQRPLLIEREGEVILVPGEPQLAPIGDPALRDLHATNPLIIEQEQPESATELSPIRSNNRSPA